MNPYDRVRLQHMAEAANVTLTFVAGRRREDLDKDPMLRFALIHAVTIIGEAAARITPETRTELADLPWAR